jgi:hypothetical protein
MVLFVVTHIRFSLDSAEEPNLDLLCEPLSKAGMELARRYELSESTQK